VTSFTVCLLKKLQFLAKEGDNEEKLSTSLPSAPPIYGNPFKPQKYPDLPPIRAVSGKLDKGLGLAEVQMALPSATQGLSPTHWATVNNKLKTDFLIDTGAQLFMIKPESCPGAIPLKHQKTLVTGINGAVVTYSIVTVKLELPFCLPSPPKRANVTRKPKYIWYGYAVSWIQGNADRATETTDE